MRRGLARSKVLLFLFDPTQDPRFRAACQGRSSDPQISAPKAQIFRQDTVLHEAANRIRKYTELKHNERHDRPLIVVVTKYDAWASLLPGILDTPPWNPVRSGSLASDSSGRHSSHGILHALDMDRIEETSRRVRDLLWRYSPEMISAAEGFAKEVLYVPVSATGCSPVVDQAGAIHGMRRKDIRPMWVETPMLVVLAKWAKGLIPYAMRKQNPSAPGSSSPPQVDAWPPPGFD